MVSREIQNIGEVGIMRIDDYIQPSKRLPSQRLKALPSNGADVCCLVLV